MFFPLLLAQSPVHKCAGIYQSMRCAVCIEIDGGNNGIRFVNRLKEWMEEKKELDDDINMHNAQQQQ